MKTLLLSLSLLAPALLGAADRPYTVAEKGPNHRKLVWTTPVLSPDGVAGQEEHSVIELGSGMHYLDPETGQYRESRELIEIVPGGAVARFGPHRVAWAANLNTRGALDLELPDGRHLVSHVLGLALTDYGPQRRSILISSLKDSVGVITDPNCLVYDDCFVEIKAKIRYTYCKGSLEQDCLLLEQLPVSPADFGLDPLTTRLELFTEFLTPPEPRQARRSLRAATPDAPALEDTDLDWGSMRIGAGRGFLAPAPGRSGTVPSLKSWTWRENRCFLLESFEYEAVQRHLARLPQAANAARTARRLKDMAALRAVREPGRATEVAWSLPPAPGAGSKQRAEVMLAGKATEEPAYVLDYIICNSSLTNYLFAPDSTYLINSPVHLYGADNVIAGGCVLKFAPDVNAGLQVHGDLHTATSPSKIAVLTARDDGTVGESLPDSTGTPSGYYASNAIAYAGTLGPAAFHDLRISYAEHALSLAGTYYHELRHAQLLNCGTGVNLEGSQVAWRNVLAWNLTNAVTGSGGSNYFRAENVTFHQVASLAPVGDTTVVALVNGLLSATGFNPSYPCVNTVTDAGNAFVTVGGGSHYLADSTNCSFGTTDSAHLDPTLLAELKLRTTHPPLLLTNLTQDVVLQPVVPLDTNGQAIGYHYPVLDFLAAGVSVSSNVTVLATDGVTIGLQNTIYAPAFTLNAARFISEGSPIRLNGLLGASLVQEGAADTWQWFGGGTNSAWLSELRLRHTATAQLQHGGSIHGDMRYFSAIEFSHCQVFNKYGSPSTGNHPLLVTGFTNTYWERGTWVLAKGGSANTGTHHLRNNLFRNLYFAISGANSNWVIRDNFFELARVVSNGPSNVTSLNSHNAYFHSTNVLRGGVSDVPLNTWTWLPGPLGDFYQTTDSLCLNAGSVTADLAMLYQFTTTTNQVKETNSLVDIGLHYVAVDAAGQPMDTDGDGLPDHVEDRNSNGQLDPDALETDWWTFSTITNRVPGLEVFTPLK